jgi:tetratricopeptide (TPR) repeat protein
MPAHWIRRSLAVVLLGAVAISVSAQPQEPAFKNLKVLPKDISDPELKATMFAFTRALGVRCTYCHVGEEHVKPEDFQKDDKPQKRVAREMMRMVHDINEDYLGHLETRAKPEVGVKCATCHRGVAQPRMLQDVLTASYETGGIDSTVARYQALRGRYYGRAAYDFGEGSLADVSNQLARQGHADDATRLLELNLEMNPNSNFAKRTLASATISKGFTTSPEAGAAAYADAKTKFGDRVVNEDLLNDVGFQLLGRNQTAAIAALKLNVTENPKSANAYDSLGEAYVAAADWKQATDAYKKSLALDPTNDNAKKALEDIKVKSKQKPAKK